MKSICQETKTFLTLVNELTDIQAILQDYRTRWKVPLMICDSKGLPFSEEINCKSLYLQECNHTRQLSIEEALRWGEPTIRLCPGKHFIFAVPLMLNSIIMGGLVASVSEIKVFPDNNGKPAFDLIKASMDLLRVAEEGNLTNAVLLEHNRTYHRTERLRAEAIHNLKAMGIMDFKEHYGQIQHGLLMAIRRGNREEARGLINRLLVVIIHETDGKLDLMKSFFIELVITLYRTAIELGGEKENLLGTDYSSIIELYKISSEEELAPWLTKILDSIIDSIHVNSRKSASLQMSMAYEYIKENYTSEITRDDVASHVFMSPSNFSRQFNKHFKRSFSDMLNQMRVDRACELLIRTDMNLVVIALETGFTDQSYLSKVFRKIMEMTPQEYRNRHR